MTATADPAGSSGTVALSRKIGRAMAVLSTLFGLLYLLGLGVNLATSGSVHPSGDDVRVVSGGIALLWNLALVVLFATLRREAEPSRAILAELSLIFAILVCGTSCASWFAGLTAFRRITESADPNLATLLDPYNETSLTYALEHLGWGLFFGVASLLAGLALVGKRVASGVPWSLGVAGVLSLAHFLGVVTGQDALTALGYISWGVALPISSALLARMFRQRLRESKS